MSDETTCQDHWHCDPAKAPHICDQGTIHKQQDVRVKVDRTKPCPTCSEEPLDEASYHVKVVWSQDADAGYGGQEPAVYTFDTKAAADAFLLALSEHDGWLEADSVELVLPAVPEPEPAPTKVEEVHIVFDGPPGPQSGRFVEVETPDGRSISVGEWKQRADGLWALVLRVERRSDR